MRLLPPRELVTVGPLMRTRRIALGVAALTALASAHDAAAYEFSARAYALGQAYQLRSFGSYGRVGLLSRQRFTQSLDLSIWDIPGWQQRRLRHGDSAGGVRISFVSSVRIDHDFGTYSAGAIRIDNRARDALDLIPELGTSVLGLDLLYGYFHVDGVAGDRVAFDAGRLVGNDGFEHYSVDGVRATALLHRGLSVRATGGVRVREASPLGFAASEIDGTTGADCREYVEGATPGTGRWQAIAPDRLIVNQRLASDYEYCPQRSVMMPMVDVAAVSAGVPWLAAEVGYRRAWSSSVDLLGDVNRLRYPDLGYYPNENGQAPSTGINQEVAYWHLHGKTRVGTVALRPYWDARYSLLHARVDRSIVGVRAVKAGHAVDVSSQYLYPTFDGDSIFSIFVVEPALDVRVAYTYDGGRAGVLPNTSPRHFASLRLAGTFDSRRPLVRPRTLRLEAWGKRFLDPALPPSSSAAAQTQRSAGGMQAVIEQGVTSGLVVRAVGLYDAGYGGRRIAASSELIATPSRTSLFATRLAVVALETDNATNTVVRSPMSESWHARALWRPFDYVGVGAMLEWNHNSAAGNDVRGWLSLSLGYVPEQ